MEYTSTRIVSETGKIAASANVVTITPGHKFLDGSDGKATRIFTRAGNWGVKSKVNFARRPNANHMVSMHSVSGISFPEIAHSGMYAELGPLCKLHFNE